MAAISLNYLKPETRELASGFIPNGEDEAPVNKVLAKLKSARLIYP